MKIIKPFIVTLFLLGAHQLLGQTNKLDDTGSVGVGTVSPKTLFHIQKGASVGIKSNYATAIVENVDAHLDITSSPDATWGSSINLVEGIGSSNKDIWSIVRQTTNGAGDSSLRFNFGNSNQHNNPTLLTLLPSGNLGIGITSPTSKLQVEGIGTIGAQWNPTNSYFSLSSGSNLLIMDPNEIYASGTMALGAKSGSIIFRTLIGETSAADRMVITNLGNVGIGTGSPSQKLEVNGSIKTKEVNVTTSGWADYVFDEGHSLIDLGSLKDYIQKEKHLPGIPTAQEVAESGLNLGEMNVKLLEKIEELTLYIIDQEEKLAEQNKQNIKQSEEIGHLQNEILKIKKLLLER